MRKIIEATEGHILTNGEIFGNTIYLAEGETGDDFHEITDAEYEALQEAEEATADDYQAALSRLGVNI
jgi:hypothetical protein